MKLLVISCLVAVAVAVPLTDTDLNEWKNFKETFGKQYENDVEESERYKIFLANRDMINKHNELYENGLKTYKLKMNQFGDWTIAERQTLTSYSAERTHSGEMFSPLPNMSRPSSVDWRKKGAVTEVKDQGHCGSCWAFSATGSLEGQLKLKSGKLVSLSEQDLVDCSIPQGNKGCQGGAMDKAFSYIQTNRGIDTEKSYPYEARDSVCRFKRKTVGGTVSGFKDIPRGNEKALQSAIATVGPISVAIDASGDEFHFYSEGVYYNEECHSIPFALNHGVLAVGYGTENGEDYYIVKNSWATTWGDSGYIKMSRNKNNNCGIATMSSYPLV